MSGQPFALRPFTSAQPFAAYSLTGTVARNADTLALTWLLQGPLTQLQIAAPDRNPTRRFSLWEETCFEFFLAPKDGVEYWEFNLSPAGHWNVFHFDAYRQGMRAETAFVALPFKVFRQDTTLHLNFEIELLGSIFGTVDFHLGITAVLKNLTGESSYWALAHPAPEADFHHADSRILRI